MRVIRGYWNLSFPSILMIAMLPAAPCDARDNSQLAHRRHEKASAVATLQQQLRSVPDSEGEVPPEVRRLLRELKHELLALVESTLNQNPLLAPADVQKQVAKQLRAAGVEIGSGEWSRWGDVEEVSITRPNRRAALLTVFTELGIRCGSDGSVYVFELRNGTWEVVLSWEANDYAEINGAHGGVLYMLGASGQSDWFLVTANTKPWCTSVWAGFDYTVLRKGTDHRSHKIIFHRHEMIAVDEDIKLGGDDNRFTVEFTTGDEVGNRRRVRRSYSVKGDVVRLNRAKVMDRSKTP